MADILLDTQTFPSTPSAGKGIIYFDSTAKLPAFVNESGRAGLLTGTTFNASITSQSATFGSDIFLTDSDLLIPSFGLQARTQFFWQISASKTAAGVATPIYSIRLGSARTTSDTAVLQLTGPAQTAVIDIGTLNILAVIRSVGASGVLQATAWWDHRGTATSSTGGTGFANDGSGHVEATSAGFDTTGKGGQYISLSLNGGASAAWTVTLVSAEGMW